MEMKYEWWEHYDITYTEHKWTVYSVLYHYCAQYHGGQFSDLYRVLCKVANVYHPGRTESLESAIDSDPAAMDFYNRLQRREWGR